MEMQTALHGLGKSIMSALRKEKQTNVDKMRFSLGDEVKINSSHYNGENLEELGSGVMEHYFALSMKLEESIKNQQTEIHFMVALLCRGRKVHKEDTFFIDLPLDVQAKLLELEFEEVWYSSIIMLLNNIKTGNSRFFLFYEKWNFLGCKKSKMMVYF